MLYLPPKIDGIYPTSHVCYLHKCLVEEESVIPLSEIRVGKNKHCIEDPEAIAELKTKKSHHKDITTVKVQQKHCHRSNMTWEAKTRAEKLLMLK